MMKALAITLCVALMVGATLRAHLRILDLDEKIMAQSAVIYGLFEQLKASGVLKEEEHEN